MARLSVGVGNELTADVFSGSGLTHALRAHHMSKKLKCFEGEVALFWLEGETGCTDRMKYCAEAFEMFIKRRRKDDYIIQVNETRVPFEIRENAVHHSLECGRCRAKSEWQHFKLEQSVRGNEGSLFTVSFINFNLPVSATQVDGRKISGMAESIEGVIDT